MAWVRTLWVPCEGTKGRAIWELKLYTAHAEPRLFSRHMAELVVSWRQKGSKLEDGDYINKGRIVFMRIAEPLPVLM